jgi:hypothetical protein
MQRQLPQRSAAWISSSSEARAFTQCAAWNSGSAARRAAAASACLQFGIRWCTGRGLSATFVASSVSQMRLRIAHFHAPGACCIAAIMSARASSSFARRSASNAAASNGAPAAAARRALGRAAALTARRALDVRGRSPRSVTPRGGVGRGPAARMRAGQLAGGDEVQHVGARECGGASVVWKSMLARTRRGRLLLGVAASACDMASQQKKRTGGDGGTRVPAAPMRCLCADVGRFRGVAASHTTVYVCASSGPSALRHACGCWCCRPRWPRALRLPGLKRRRCQQRPAPRAGARPALLRLPARRTSRPDTRCRHPS